MAGSTHRRCCRAGSPTSAWRIGRVESRDAPILSSRGGGVRSSVEGRGYPRRGAGQNSPPSHSPAPPQALVAKRLFGPVSALGSQQDRLGLGACLMATLGILAGQWPSTGRRHHQAAALARLLWRRAFVLLRLRARPVQALAHARWVRVHEKVERPEALCPVSYEKLLKVPVDRNTQDGGPHSCRELEAAGDGLEVQPGP